LTFHPNTVRWQKLEYLVNNLHNLEVRNTMKNNIPEIEQCLNLNLQLITIDGLAGTGKSLSVLSAIVNHDLSDKKLLIRSLFSGGYDNHLKNNGVPSYSFINSNSFKKLPATIEDTVLIVDDADKGLAYSELANLVLRIGKGSTIIVIGDSHRSSEFHMFTKVAMKVKQSGYIKLGLDKVVRSDLVRNWLASEFNYYTEVV